VVGPVKDKEVYTTNEQDDEKEGGYCSKVIEGIELWRETPVAPVFNIEE